MSCTSRSTRTLHSKNRHSLKWQETGTLNGSGWETKWESMLDCEDAGLLQHIWWRAARWSHSRGKLQPGQGLWSPTLVLEKQDTRDPEALPMFLATPVYSFHLESAFRHRLPVFRVFCMWKHKAAYRPFTEELDWMTLVVPFHPRIFCDSEFKFIIQNCLGEQGLKRQQDRMQVVVWNARQWCWGWPCPRAECPWPPSHSRGLQTPVFHCCYSIVGEWY